ncbi:MAG: family 16 glycoside hydrolase, partial [Candidatus Poribacteria bacterium]
MLCKKSKFVIIVFILGLFLQIQFASALYFDFEDEAQLKQWETVGTWKIVKDSDKKSNVLSGEGANEVIALVGEKDWKDYTIEFEANGQTDEISVVFRGQDSNNFLSFMIAPSLNLAEFFKKEAGAFDENIAQKADSLGVKIQQWNKYKVVVQNDKATVFLNGKEVLKPLEIANFKGFEKGRVGFRQWSDKAYYDNLLITGTGIPRTPGEPGAVELKNKLTTTWGKIK